MVATSNIPRGALIMQEDPLIKCPTRPARWWSDNDITVFYNDEDKHRSDYLMKAYNKLPVESRAIFDTLQSGTSTKNSRVQVIERF
jgi:hypothetical protein